jgi:hypothetical protein
VDGVYRLGHGSSSGESERGNREVRRRKRGALGTGRQGVKREEWWESGEFQKRQERQG